MMKKAIAFTLAGASVASVLALRQRGVLPKVKVDMPKVREAVTVEPRTEGRHAVPTIDLQDK